MIKDYKYQESCIIILFNYYIKRMIIGICFIFYQKEEIWQYLGVYFDVGFVKESIKDGIVFKQNIGCWFYFGSQIFFVLLQFVLKWYSLEFVIRIFFIVGKIMKFKRVEEKLVEFKVSSRCLS